MGLTAKQQQDVQDLMAMLQNLQAPQQTAESEQSNQSSSSNTVDFNMNNSSESSRGFFGKGGFFGKKGTTESNMSSADNSSDFDLFDDEPIEENEAPKPVSKKTDAEKQKDIADLMEQLKGLGNSNDLGKTGGFVIDAEDDEILDFGDGTQSHKTTDSRNVSTNKVNSDLAQALQERDIVCKPMMSLKFRGLDKRSQQANIERAQNDISTKTFNILNRKDVTFGLKHLCWDLSILFLSKALDTNIAKPEIANFCSNYALKLFREEIKLDCIPTESEIKNMLKPIQNQDRNGNYTGDFRFSNVCEVAGLSRDLVDDREIDNQRYEENSGYNTEQCSPRQISRQNGRNNIDVKSLKTRPILLNYNNSIDAAYVESKSVKSLQRLFKTNKGTSYLFKQRTKSLIGAIKQAIKDSNAVTRIIIQDYTLIVNGRMVDTDSLIDDQFGVRFEDFVVVKDLLKEFRMLQTLTIDSIMFDQVVRDYGSSAQDLWIIFQQNKNLTTLNVQYEPGCDFYKLTRENFTDRARDVQDKAKLSKWRGQLETTAALNNPRLGDKGMGYAKNAFDLTSQFGDAAKKQLLANNPHMFRAGIYGVLATVTVGAGVIIGAPSLILKIFQSRQ